MPIRLIAVFETYTVFKCFDRDDEFDAWIEEHKLQVIKCTMVGNFTCWLAAKPNIKYDTLL